MVVDLLYGGVFLGFRHLARSHAASLRGAACTGYDGSNRGGEYDESSRLFIPCGRRRPLALSRQGMFICPKVTGDVDYIRFGQTLLVTILSF